MAAFERKFGFAVAVGCVDGTRIAILQPLLNASDFVCYKMKYSLNCQAICDEKGIFTDVEIRWPGSVHDARVFANSGINLKFRDDGFLTSICNLLKDATDVLPVLLADPAYPLMPNLMKEFPADGSNREVQFNNKLRAARNRVECAFGRLKSRWRILNRTLDLDLDVIPEVIYSCFALHNFCELHSVEDVSRTHFQRQIEYFIYI